MNGKQKKYESPFANNGGDALSYRRYIDVWNSNYSSVAYIIITRILDII